MDFDLYAGGFRTVSGFRGFRYLAKVAFEWISWISIFRQWISYILWISWILIFRQTRSRVHFAAY